MGKTGDLRVVDSADDVLSLHSLAPAAPAVVWDVLVDPARWWPDLALTPAVGARFVERWRDDAGAERTTAGTVLAFDPGHSLTLDWRDDDWPTSTTVRLRIEPADGEGTVVHVEHRGWSRFGAAGPALRDAHAAGWAVHLRDLAAAVERAAADR